MHIHADVRVSPSRRAYQLFLACFLALLCPCLTAQEVLYQSDLAKAQLGPLPSEFMVLNGEFAVKEEDGKRFIELPEAPLDTFQLLFGPARKDDTTASARCWGAKKGRLFPTFALGVGGQSGYRLQVSPGKGAVELFRGEEVIASKPFIWQSEKWTSLKLELVKTGEGEWTVRGKAWGEEGTEPAAWLVSSVVKEEPVTGRASVWGSPFSGRPIRFDSLKVMRAGP